MNCTAVFRPTTTIHRQCHRKCLGHPECARARAIPNHTSCRILSKPPIVTARNQPGSSATSTRASLARAGSPRRPDAARCTRASAIAARHRTTRCTRPTHPTTPPRRPQDSSQCRTRAPLAATGKRNHPRTAAAQPSASGSAHRCRTTVCTWSSRSRGSRGSAKDTRRCCTLPSRAGAGTPRPHGGVKCSHAHARASLRRKISCMCSILPTAAARRQPGKHRSCKLRCH